MKTVNGKIAFSGYGDFFNPLDSPYPKKDYSEGKESARISYKKIWIDGYNYSADKPNQPSDFFSSELKMLSNGKCFIDGREIKRNDEIENVREIFKNISLE